MPTENEALMMRHKGETIRSTTYFKSLKGILAGPVPLTGRPMIMSIISLSEI